jgi:Pectate lyase superfamily protein
MPLKSIPTIGDPNWGTPLNAHLAQLQNPTNGGINTFEQFSQRPTNLAADDKGKTYLYTQTGNLHQWTGTIWKVLNESVINVKDYGAVGDGVADDTLAVQKAININKNTFFPSGNYKINEVGLQIKSNCNYYGEGNDIILSYYESPNMPVSGTNEYNLVGQIFKCWDVKNCKIFNLTFEPVNSSLITKAYTGPVVLYNCENCEIRDCIFRKWKAFGIWAYGDSASTKAKYCKIKNCWFDDWVSSIGASFGAIFLGSGSEGFVVENNTILGESTYGVSCYDGYNNGVSIKHNIINNRIENQITYGILVYCTALGTKAYITINKNRIKNIQGSVVSVGVKSFGAGIYCVGANDLIITENIISECNIATDDETLAPGCIGISNCYGNVIVSNNSCFDSYWNGIRITTNYIAESLIPANVDKVKGFYTVSGNICKNIKKEAYNFNTIRNVIFTGNIGSDDLYLNQTVAFFKEFNNSIIANNRFTITSQNAASVVTLVNSNSVIFNDNIVSSIAPGNYCRFLDLTKSIISDNVFESNNTGTTETVWFQNFANGRVHGNAIYSPNPIKVSFYNTCTNSFVDKSNRWALAQITQSGVTGLTIDV